MRLLNAEKSMPVEEIFRLKPDLILKTAYPSDAEQPFWHHHSPVELLPKAEKVLQQCGCSDAGFISIHSSISKPDEAIVPKHFQKVGMRADFFMEQEVVR